jgi:hypothetical protein
MTYHRILRLTPHESDPVQIISAAYVQLRRWRGGDVNVPTVERQRRVRLIIVAREALLRRAVAGRSSTRRSRSTLGRLALGRTASKPGGVSVQTPSSRPIEHEKRLGDGIN